MARPVLGAPFLGEDGINPKSSSARWNLGLRLATCVATGIGTGDWIAGGIGGGTGTDGPVASWERLFCCREMQNGPPQLLSSSEKPATIEPGVLVLGMLFSEDIKSL